MTQAATHRADRPYPAPNRGWAVFMRWHDLLFMHWPLPAERMRAFVPAGLKIEEFGGSAWLGIVPFRMTGIRHRFLPPIPGLSAFPELNVRTYVRGPDGRPGVWFFSLDASHRLAVRVARRVYGLAYMDAAMECRRDEGRVAYSCRRCGPHTSLACGETCSKEGELIARYGACGPVFNPSPGTLEDFLTGRYCLYAWHRGQVRRAEIDHGPWPLREAWAEIERNTMAAALGLEDVTRGAPLLHYAGRLDVVAWLAARVG